MNRASFSNIETIRSFDNMEVLHARLSDCEFPPHFHDTFVIQLVYAGVDRCQESGLEARESQIFVHTPFATHRGGPSGNKPLEYKAIYPSKAILERLFPNGLPHIPQLSFVSDNQELKRTLNAFFESKDQGRSGGLTSIFKEVLLEMRRAVGDDLSPTPSQHNDLELAREYLVDNCQRDVSIAELSDLCLLSPFHLIRCFKQRFGITPRQFLICQRVLLAKKLLVEGESIAAVALKAGFADQSHLTRCFKRVSGFNPGQYARG